MGELADDFKFMKEEANKIRAKKEPSRFEYATDKLIEAGHRVVLDPQDNKSLIINGYIKLWPYTGWWAGKRIGSGRGVHNLIERIKDER
jgi:hypothetical protein